ncbi:MAG TPA: hypothetical protein G4N98_04810 [Thermoflexia bacterium]|nr:hypothetical protein [Thermoflexia bacterium]
MLTFKRLRASEYRVWFWLLPALLLALLAPAAVHTWRLRVAGRAVLYNNLAGWLEEYALPVERVAVSSAGLPHFTNWPVVELPEKAATSTLLETLQKARPDYVVTPRSVAWDGVYVQPWFQERYHIVATEFDPYDAATPLILYRYTPAPFDNDFGETVICEDGSVAEIAITNCRLHGLRLLPAVPLYLTVELRGTLAVPLRSILRLVAEADERVWLQEERRLATDLWYEELPMKQEYRLVPPQGMPVGAYRLELAFYRPNQAPLGTPLILATLQSPPTVSFDPPRPEHSLQLTFGEDIQLVGYDAPARAAPGDTVLIALYWRARGAMPTDYKVFVHLLGDDGEVLAQDDAQPAHWTYPTTEWQPGEYIRDEHLLYLPPETPRGDWRLTVGVYAAETGERLPVRGADGVLSPERREMLFRLRVR